MMPVRNVQVQLVDTPAMEGELVEPALFELARHADLLLLVVDLQADPLQQLQDTVKLLTEHRIAPTGWKDPRAEEERMARLPVLILANKCDDARRDEDYQILCELFEGECPIVPVSAETGRNLDQLREAIFKRLGIIRVYARPPGKEPDMEKPFVLKQGSTITDLARKVHRDFYLKLKSARVWGSSAFDGQPVQKDYALQDEDVVELRI
jgi:ribosome-interacting GTPase 1